MKQHYWETLMSISNRSFEATRDLYHFWNTCGRKAETINNINYIPAPVVPLQCENCALLYISKSTDGGGWFLCTCFKQRQNPHIKYLKALKAIFIKTEHWNPWENESIFIMCFIQRY